MNRFFVLLSLLSSLSSFAQVESDVVELNDQIRNIVLSRSVNQRTLLRVRSQLENVLVTLNGSSTPNPDPLPSSYRLRCAARDNDNSNPWILTGERSDFTTIRYPQYTFRTLELCQKAAASGREMASGFHTCASRDNDGANPFVIASFYGERTVKRTENFRDVETCLSSLKQARASYDAFVTCVSRDNDNANPFIKLVVRSDGTSVRQTETYPSPESCFQNLK